MEVRKGYKRTEVGVIPEDWKVVRFEDAFVGFTTGMTPYRGTPSFYTGKINWITSGELNYNLIRETKEHITEDAVAKTNLTVHKPGTFLMAITGLEAAGTRGSCGIVGHPATTNQSCLALNAIPGVSLIEYLYHYYVFYGDEYALKYCQGTKQQSYTGKIVRRLPIVLPPTIHEQRAIATALSEADAYVAALEALLAKKRLVKQGVMKEVLTPGAGWREVTYGDVFKFYSTASYSRSQLSESSSVGYIHYGDIHTKYAASLDLNKIKTFVTSDLKKNYSSVIKGDLIMADASEDMAAVGNSVEVTTEIIGCDVISGLHTIHMRDTEGVFVNGFRRLIHEMDVVKNQLDKAANGLKVYGISKSALSKILIPLPPKPEQTRIATLLSDLDEELTALEAQLAKARAVKTGMLADLLTGRVRLV